MKKEESLPKNYCTDYHNALEVDEKRRVYEHIFLFVVKFLRKNNVRNIL